MRRATVIVALMVVSLGLFPARADAYFWDWLDDLSGPRMKGVSVEWQVWCRSESAARDRGLLRSALKSLNGARAKYVGATGSGHELPVESIDVSIQFINEAIRATKDEDATHALAEAIYFRDLASRQYEAVVKGVSIPRSERTPPDSIVFKPESVPMLNFGVAVSACPARALARNTHFIMANVAFGSDTKRYEDAAGMKTVDNQNRLVNAGLSLHSVVTPYLTLGIGAGVSSFSSAAADGFNTYYIEPVIVDVRPFALRRNSNLRGPWWHVLYFRYSTIVFPTGFKAGSFAGQVDRIPAEFTGSLAIHADLSPVMRKLQGKW